jgi:alpha-glucosidase
MVSCGSILGCEAGATVYTTNLTLRLQVAILPAENSRIPERDPVRVARAGRALRLVVGSDVLPEWPFAAADAPDWLDDDAVGVAWQGARFELHHDGAVVLAGRTSTTPFRVEIEVGDAAILGFGAATGEPDRNGASFRILTRDTLFYGIEGASYTAFPYFLARDDTGLRGVLVATTFPLDVVIDDGRVACSAPCDTEGTPVDLVVFRGSLAEILQQLAAHVGRSFLPPAWALGYHQSRWSYRTGDAVREVARRLRATDLPADAIHLDIHTMDRYRVFTFDRRRFPAPGPLHAELRGLGLRTLAIVDPGVSVAPYPVYDVLQSDDLLLKRRDGQPYVGRVWPGRAVFPDFSQSRARVAWGEFHRPLVEAGVAGVWNDMNDPVLRMAEPYDPLTEDVWHQGGTHRRLRNLYANGMAEAAASGLAALRPQERPFVLSRSGFLGIQRHAAVWTGDNHSTWDHLRQNLHMVLNLGLSGVPFSGADVGGFGRGPGKYGAVKLRRPSVELFVRWMELGALMPFFRNHCTLYAPRQEPWCFGRHALDLSRRVLRRRYRLLPLLYRLALEAHELGLPLVRPLFMHCDVPRDLAVDQCLLGERVLAAPVLRPGCTRREVWLPPGAWLDWNSGAMVAGGRSIAVPAPLGTTPLFVRAGTALFLAEPGRNAEETLRASLSLEVTCPDGAEAGAGSLFLDDGVSPAGPRFVLDVAVEARPGGLQLRFHRTADGFVPQQRDLELRLPPASTRAVVDGMPRALEPRGLAAEDRGATWQVVRIPLETREVDVALPGR